MYLTDSMMELQGDKKWGTIEAYSYTSLKENLVKDTLKKNEVAISSETKYDVTFVSQASFNRWSFLLEIAKRWKGPMSICFYILKEEVPKYNRRVAEARLRENIHLDYRIQTNLTHYPLNELRNIAISHVTTSHFYLSDMDVWPSESAYDAIISLPPADLERDKLAIIVPAYQIKMATCDTFEECATMYRTFFPRDKQQLRACVHSRRCAQFRPREFLHDYYPHDWFYTSRKLIPVECFKSDTQEPYVVVKKTPDLPRFSEDFVNYSYDKVQWIEHLRWLGYAFEVLADGFSVDIPHPDSSYRKQFFKELKQTRVFPMMDLYHSFLDHLNKTVENKAVVKLCDKAHINPRKIVFYSDFKK